MAPTPSRNHRSVRIPLATGATASGMLWWGTLLLVTALLAAALVIPLSRLPRTPDAHRYALPLVPLLFLLGSVFFHLQALRARASDVLLDGDGLRIEGGPLHGERFPFAELDLDGCRIEANYNTTQTAGDHATYEQQLILRRRSGAERVVARSLDDGEHASFEALLETLRALGGRPAAPAPVAPAAGAAARLILCPSCGAPVPPVDAAAARCGFCGAEAPMSAEVRERLQRDRAAYAAEERAQRRLQRLLQRPQAGHSNRWLLGALAAKYLLPVLLLVALRYWLCLLALVFVLARVVKMKLAARRVYQRLILDLTATPAAPGAPPCCRRCGGPLPAAQADALLCRCAYCGADNLLGIDVHQRQGRAERRDAELFGLLLLERHQRLRHALWIGAGLAVALYGVLRAG